MVRTIAWTVPYDNCPPLEHVYVLATQLHEPVAQCGTIVTPCQCARRSIRETSKQSNNHAMHTKVSLGNGKYIHSYVLIRV